MSTQPQSFLTPEEYLEIERKAERKSEYYQGEMFAMAGASESHNLILTNLITQLGQQLQKRPWRLYASDMRVQVGEFFAYPDASVVCGERSFADNKFDTLANPTLICEVLSPSTEGYDRGLKFDLYQAIESLQQYLMISSDRMRANLYTRQADGTWLRRSASRPEEVVELQSVECRLTLADLYEKVELAGH